MSRRLTLRAPLVAAWLLVGSTAGAQTTEPIPRIDFDEAIDLALEKNPVVAQAAVAIARADALVQQARALTIPTVSAGLTNTTLDSQRGFAGGVTQPQNQFAFSASARYSVGGWIDVGQARDQVDVATASAGEVRQRIGVTAAQAYLAVIASRRQVEVSTRAVEVAREHLDYATRRLEGGAGSRLNQLRAAQALTSDEVQLENARIALRRAQEALGVVLAADGPLDAGTEPPLDVGAAIDEATWRLNRPDLQTQLAVRRAAERVVRDHWIDWAPLPTLSFDPQIITPSGLFQPSRTWRFSVTMVQPLFDGGERRARLALRRQAVQSATLTLSETEIRARSEIRIAQEALTSLERALASARTAAEQAAEVLRITTAAFEVGATTNIEVIDAQRAARDAESAAATAEDAVRRGRLDLLVATGRFPN